MIESIESRDRVKVDTNKVVIEAIKNEARNFLALFRSY